MILVGVMPGVIFAILFSLYRLIKAAAQPPVSVQGKVQDRTTFQNIQDNPEAKQIPGILVLKIEAALIFFNSDFVKIEILKKLSEQTEKINCLIINAQSINLIDVTAANMIENLNSELLKQGTKLIFARPNSRFTSMINELDMIEHKPDEVYFNSVNEAVEDCLSKQLAVGS